VADTFPINLLLSGKMVLVTGSGSAARRRVRGLMAAGAQVDWYTEDQADLAGSDNLNIFKKTFDSTSVDLSRYSVIFASDETDSPANRELVEQAQKQHVLVGSITDWKDTDFLNPSVFDWGKSKVAISTGGTSYRRARFQKERLKKLINVDTEKKLIIVGVDHKSISFGDIAKLHPDDTARAKIERRLSFLSGVEEFVLLLTCNRIEFYGMMADDNDLIDLVAEILGFDKLPGNYYVIPGAEALTHAVDLVAGHHSAVIGETQICGQFKRAIWDSQQRGTAGVSMQKLLDTVMAVSKKVRAQQGQVLQNRSIPAVAAAMIATDCGCLNGKKALVLGAGEIGAEAICELGKLPGVELAWANRTLDRIPANCGAKALALDQALASMSEFDFIVSALGGDAPELGSELFKTCVEIGKKTTVIDLSMPPKVDLSVADNDGMTLIGLDEIKRFFSSNMIDRNELFSLTRHQFEDAERAALEVVT
jgi:glutamyl-tRNA reductase